MGTYYSGKKRKPFYGTTAWRKVRELALMRDHYWCTACKRRPANVVHHVIPIDERPDLALEPENLRSVCADCHNSLHPERSATDGRRRRRKPTDPEGINIARV